MSDSKKTKTGNIFDFYLLRKVFDLISEYKGYFYFAIVLTFIAAVIGPAVPFLIQHTIDNQIISFDGRGLKMMSLIILGLMLLQAFLQYVQTYLLNWLGQNAIMKMRSRIFNHITGFRSRVFDQTPLGTFITRTISDVEAVASVFSQGLINIIGDMLQIIVILAFMFYIDWRLTLVCLSVFPVLLIGSYIFKEAVKKAFQDVRNQVARLNSFLQEHITGMNIIQLFSKEEQEYKRFQKINESHRDAHIRSVLYYSIFFPFIEVISAIALALIIWYGAQNVITGHLTFGVLTGFILYMNLLFRPIRQIADRFNTLQMGMVASERVFKLMDKVDHIPDGGQLKPEKLSGSIRFDHVYFAYKEPDYILKDVSFEVNPGESLAIVGATGAGKSTIINLINRMYDIQKGQIILDGEDIKNYELHWLRKQIAVVLQDVFLFSDSIANNIRLYNEEISREQIVEAAKMLGAETFINALPDGLDYQVRERGATLSAGQRQLVSFIRAVIQNPAVLILDEATSSIDNETEEIIQKATKVLLENRTSIIIAHRLATIQNADHIMVLDKGKIHEYGTHQQLLERDGLYRKLCKLQFTELEI